MKSRSKSSDTDVDSGWSCYARERFIGAIVGTGSCVSGAKCMCTGGDASEESHSNVSAMNGLTKPISPTVEVTCLVELVNS